MSKNPCKNSDIIPFFGPYNTKCIGMNAIYIYYNGSELEEVVVVGVVAKGSVEHGANGIPLRLMNKLIIER